MTSSEILQEIEKIDKGGRPMIIYKSPISDPLNDVKRVQLQNKTFHINNEIPPDTFPSYHFELDSIKDGLDVITHFLPSEEIDLDKFSLDHSKPIYLILYDPAWQKK